MLHSVVSHAVKKKVAQSLCSCVVPFFYPLPVFVTQSRVTVDISSLKPAYYFSLFFSICVNPIGFEHCSLAPLEKNALRRHHMKWNALLRPTLQLKSHGVSGFVKPVIVSHACVISSPSMSFCLSSFCTGLGTFPCKTKFAHLTTGGA